MRKLERTAQALATCILAGKDATFAARTTEECEFVFKRVKEILAQYGVSTEDPKEEDLSLGLGDKDE